MFITGYSFIQRDPTDQRSEARFLRDETQSSARGSEREDRAVLSEMTALALLTVERALEMACVSERFSPEQRSNTYVFSASEPFPQDFDSIARYIHELREEGQVDEKFERMSLIGKLMNPLTMFKKLSTNSIYHISKRHGFTGGGYPIVRASLSGLVALEELHFQMRERIVQSAVLSSDGNMLQPIHLAMHSKISPLMATGRPTVPNLASVALFIEQGTEARGSDAKAEVLDVTSVYQPSSRVTAADWIRLLEPIRERFRLVDPCVVLYGMGDASALEDEKSAIRQVFPGSRTFSYKPENGYSGKSNNLVDLVRSLMDPEIPVGAHVLVNGVGFCSGFGTILIKKLGGKP